MRAVIAIVLGLSATAHAQSSAEEDRFFVDKQEGEGGEEKTLWQGSLTSTSFLYREAAGISDPLTGGQVGFENASPMRWFTDLRAQLDAIHIAGKTWDARVDARARAVNTITSGQGGMDTIRPQSGALYGNEYEVRDLYVVRGSVRTDLTVGRQTVLDIAAMKIDGARFDYAKSRRWTYLGFAGLYPTRGSRSVTTDYPVNFDGKRVMPAAVGGGGAYRTLRTYGAIGAAAIVPLAREDDTFGGTGTMEQPRAFVTSNGYWRRSAQLDIFHYLVLDVVGSAGFAITNGSLGVNYRPQPRLHVNGTINHIDTETLNVQAQTQLLDPPDDRPGATTIQNNLTVARISSDSARVSVSAALGRTMRWEVTVAGAARNRPQITLTGVDGDTTQTIPAARSGEVFFQAVDRKFFGGLRLAASFVRVFGLGGGNRSTSSIFTLTANREFREGRGEWEAQLGYLGSKDSNGELCNITDLQTCYGTSSAGAITASGTAFYRLKKDWFVMGTLELARRTLTTLDNGGMAVSNPAIIGTTAFARIAYRF